MFYYWQPLGGTIWHTDNAAAQVAMWSICALGFAIVLLSTFLIHHFDLFGLRQVWLYLRGREYTHLRFRTPLFYKYVRHPLYAGWLLAFWATPTMTAAHLLFAVMTTGYILVAIRFEERDLVKLHGQTYRRYQESVPMLVPGGGRAREAAELPAAAER